MRISFRKTCHASLPSWGSEPCIIYIYMYVRLRGPFLLCITACPWRSWFPFSKYTFPFGWQWKTPHFFFLDVLVPSSRSLWPSRSWFPPQGTRTFKELFLPFMVLDFEVPFISELPLTLFRRHPWSQGPNYLIETLPKVLIPSSRCSFVPEDLITLEIPIFAWGHDSLLEKPLEFLISSSRRPLPPNSFPRQGRCQPDSTFLKYLRAPFVPKQPGRT